MPWDRPCRRAPSVRMQKLESLQQALSDLTPQGAHVELAVLVGALAVAYGAGLAGARQPGARAEHLVRRRIYDGVFFPLAALLVGRGRRAGR